MLEPLLDYWLEGYEWRREEEGFNEALPQFRVGVEVPVLNEERKSKREGEGKKEKKRQWKGMRKRRGKSGGADIESGPATNSQDEDSKESLRIHFVHRRSTHPNAIPLLICHTWPSSFIEVQRVIEALAEPPPGQQGENIQAFHVVAPSIPGFGFSDASMKEEFGVVGTAKVFDALMGRLGYAEGGYVAGGTGWYVYSSAI